MFAKGKKMKKSDERFKVVYTQGISNAAEVIVDLETGVNYLCYSNKTSMGVGLTVLLNEEGNPIITPIEE